MSADSECEPRKHVFGEAMQEAMAKHGCELTLEESQQFSRTLLRLFELGALVFHDADGNEIKIDDHRSHERQVPQRSVLIASDHDVIQNLDAENVASLHEPTSELNVRTARI